MAAATDGLIQNSETITQRLKRRRGSLDQERRIFEDEAKDIRRFVATETGNFETDRRETKSPDRTDQLTSTADDANEVLQSGLMSGLTSHSLPWFVLKFSDADLNEIPEAADWLYRQQEKLYRLLDGSNFYDEIPLTYKEFGPFGTAPLQVDSDPLTIFHFTHHTVGTYFLANGPRNEVDTVYIDYQRTVRQLVDEYGVQGVSGKTASSFQNSKQWDKLVDCVHVIEPNDDRIPEREDWAGQPWRSIKFEKTAMDHEEPLEMKGYDEFPFMVLLWERIASDAYGRGPGWRSLPEVKELMNKREREAKAEDKWVDPPMNIPGVLRHREASILPGAANYVDGFTGNNGLRPAQEIEPRHRDAKESRQELEMKVARIYHADVFQLLIEQDAMLHGRQRTAREIDELSGEKMVRLVPVLEQVFPQLRNLITRLWRIADRFDQFEPPPPEIVGAAIEPEFVSVLAQARQVVANTKIERYFGFVGSLAGADETVLDNVDMDETVRVYGENISIPPSIMRDKDDVSAIRQRRAQEAAARQAAEQGPAVADAVANLATTQPAENSLLEKIASAPPVAPG